MREITGVATAAKPIRRTMPAESLIRLVSGESEQGDATEGKQARLTAAEVAVLRAWIDGGPAWPDGAEPRDTKAHWSLTSLVKPAYGGGDESD